MRNFLSIAAAQAQRGIYQRHGGPFGAVITRNGKIIAREHNTVLATKNPTRHAEINAISTASQKLRRFDLSDCEIYSTTEPCPMCFSAIHWARIKTIYYSTTIFDVKKLGFNELAISNQKLKALGKTPVLLRRVKNKDCVKLLKTWSSLTTKQIY